VQVYGAMAPLTGRTHDHISPALGKEDFAPFLPYLWVSHPGRQRLVIHDRGEQYNILQRKRLRIVDFESKNHLRA
jgi:hypothetical protein